MNHSAPRFWKTPVKWLALTTLIFLAWCPTSTFAIVQQTELLNPGIEETQGDKLPADWRAAPLPGLKFEADVEEALQGERSLLVDSTEAELPEHNFIAVSQRIAAESYRGKKVRFRAAVKTSELSAGAQAQLWMRVDREASDTPGAFDNMQDRPIVNDDWEHYEIILKIDDDAKHIILGLIVVGKGKVRFDDASLEIVADETETSDMNLGSGTSDTSDSKSDKKPKPVFQRSPLIMEAMQKADGAPPQPFFNHWLWLPLFAMVLFGLSGLPDKKTDSLIEQDQNRRISGMIPKFAFRFSCAYWLIYNGIYFISTITPHYGAKLSLWYQAKLAYWAQWTATNVLKIEGELVPSIGNGSGDTTQAFIEVLLFFVAALVVAVIWSVIDRRKTNYRIEKDLLRSYLRYVLAFWMLSYGLAKVSWTGNQFGMISEYQFNKFWGESSPMNVVWSFMGTSRPYTIFAGMGEVIGGLLLIWRRTSTLGAMVVFGVMTNVMMLNFCYDVPVKLFSAHLVVMSLYIMLPEFGRLANVLFFNRAVEPIDRIPPYTNNITIWIQRAFKAAIIIIAIGQPLYDHCSEQISYFRMQASLPDYFGQYEIVEYKLADKVIEQSSSDRGWRSVRFGLANDYGPDGVVQVKKMIVGMNKVRGMQTVTFDNSDEPNLLKVTDSQGGILPTEEIRVTVIDEDQIEISGETSAGPLVVSLKRNNNIYRVRDRGFRWINEVPFNR